MSRAHSALQSRAFGADGQALFGVGRQSTLRILEESLKIKLEHAHYDAARTRVELESPDQRWFVISTDRILDQDGLPSGNIFVVSDITANKRTEEALKLSERLAATGRLAHSIAHEINNPLESIINLLYLMEHSSDPVELRSYISQATAASRACQPHHQADAGVLSGVRHASRVERG